VQQLSLVAPQLVRPLPLAAQLPEGVTQLPDEHVPEPPQIVPFAMLLHAVVLAPG
jgi:hypothetical protein